jgi:hypothetical protein
MNQNRVPYQFQIVKYLSPDLSDVLTHMGLWDPFELFGSNKGYDSFSSQTSSMNLSSILTEKLYQEGKSAFLDNVNLKYIVMIFFYLHRIVRGIGG